MISANHFELLGRDGRARTGRLTTPHGPVQTPAFMPVGTAGAMKGLHWREVRDAGTYIVLGNTYHLMLRPGAERSDIERAMQLSLRWGERSRRAFEAAPAGYMLFGIAQGGDVPELRRASARGLTEIGFHGYAIGGLAVGEPQAVMLAMIDEVTPILPERRPRYLMGVGTPEDI